ncbi:MAG TPA: class I SAM-dependent methyltransferase [Anaerolineales bacterium]|nr:class I SAM-dependent methyltransferase [Anaerolineales bacterium]
MTHQPSDKAALRGEPSYVWRAGQRRRMQMILQSAPQMIGGRVLVDGCGVGSYVAHLSEYAQNVHGLDIEFERLCEPVQPLDNLVNGVGEQLPYASESFDAILSHEVLEHVQDDRQAMLEIARVLKVGGRAVVFVPNRWYPFETHGIYWRGKYHFGNKLFVNYLPNHWRNRLAPHVKAYTRHSLRQLWANTPLQVVQWNIIYGGYDNLIAKFGIFGKILRSLLYLMENTPLQTWGLSHWVVLEKKQDSASPASFLTL